jgi:hypothetical protein
MKNRLEKPCVYHYHFSRLPDDRTDELVSTLAKQLASPIIAAHRLETEEGFDSPHPDVKPLDYRSNTETNTYCLQFWFNDILTTVATFNQTNQSEDTISYFQHALTHHFPNPENVIRFGEMAVLFAQGKAEESTARQISAACFNTEIDEDLPVCRFAWGAMYHVPEINRYILLAPESNSLPEGDTFLAFDFPMLEAIRQKLIYEEGESNKLKTQNIRIEADLKELLHSIAEKMDGREETLPEVEQLLDRMDDTQVNIYDNIARIETALHTLAINIRNFDFYLQTIPTEQDDLFAPASKNFRFIYDNIEAGLKYTKLLLPSITKRQETIPLKIDLLRQKAQEQNNRIEKRQNILIAILGVMIGTGEVLPGDFPWNEKLLWMGLAGFAAFLLVSLLNLKFFKTEK